MKHNFFISRNIPYLASRISTLVGGAILIFGYTSAGPATRDPDIGASLSLLLGYFLITVGTIVSAVILLVRKSKSSK